MSASWYDVLGVSPDATHDEIRTAWKASIDDLEPGDRRFRLYNNAAEVLLDDEARADYDRELGVGDTDAAEDVSAPATDADDPEPDSDDADAPEQDADDADDADTAADREEPQSTSHGAGGTGRAGSPVPVWLLAVVALAVVAVSTFAFLIHQDTREKADLADAVAEARTAAEDGMPLVFSYDYRHPEQDHDRATRVLTGDQLVEYERLWKDAIKPNLVPSKGVVTSKTLRSGVVNSDSSGDRVEVLLVLSTHQANATQETDLTIPMNVTMVREDGSWLISDVCAGGDCSTDGASQGQSEGESGEPSGEPRPSGNP